MLAGFYVPYLDAKNSKMSIQASKKAGDKFFLYLSILE